MSGRPVSFVFVAVALTVALLLPTPGTAQEAFTNCPERTATNATVLLPETLSVQSEGGSLPPPLVLSIVNAQGACAGRVTWTGSGTSLTIWGRSTDAEVPSAAASGPLAPNDSLRMRLYNPTEEPPQSVRPAMFVLREEADYLVTRPRFVPNGIYIVDHIRVEPPLASDAAPSTP